MKASASFGASDSRAFSGPLYAIISAMSMAAIPVISKRALATMNSQNFAAYWAWGVFLFVVLTYRDYSRPQAISSAISEIGKALLGLAIVSASSISLYMKAVQLADPTTVAFFNQAGIIYSIGLGILLLSERFYGLEAWGIGLTVLGILVITYHGGAVVMLAFVLMQLKTLADSLGAFLVKVSLSHVDTATILVPFSFLAAILTTIVALVTRSLGSISLLDVAFVLATAFFGAVGRLGFLKSLSLIKLSNATVVKSTIPLFVAVYSFVFLRTPPTSQQIIGAAVIIVGLILLSRGPEPVDRA